LDHREHNLAGLGKTVNRFFSSDSALIFTIDLQQHVNWDFHYEPATAGSGFGPLW